MNRDPYNILIIGVGGQGIGLLSEVLIRALDHAGLQAKGVDTHGLAQRQGTVISHIRVGEQVFTPLIRPGAADLVIALERYEAMRGLLTYLKPLGVLVFYNAAWQPLSVRARQEAPLQTATLLHQCQVRKATAFPVVVEGLPDPRMQNIAVLAELPRRALLPEVKPEHYRNALTDLLAGSVLQSNLALFERLIA